MKLDSRGTEVEIFGAEGEAQEFQIQASAIAFETLSSKLYADPKKAIIRELSCNAYDAHVMVGHKKKPFDVNLPTLLNLEFIIRDYGPGMSDEQIMSLYCTYFASSKQATNKQIGGFGIGSKSPFSYTDGFTVISRQGGEKRTYSAFVSEKKVPSVIRLSTEQTDEPDGLEVKFPVKQQDFNDFEYKAREVYEFFDPVPNVNRPNFEPVKQAYRAEGKRWKIRQQGSAKGVRVIMGGVPYRVEGLSEYNGKTAAERALAKMPLDIFLPIGTLSPAATRESLTNDQQTTERTAKLVEEIYQEIIDHVNGQMQASATGYERLSQLRLFSEVPGLDSVATKLIETTVKDKTLFPDEVVKAEDFPRMAMSLGRLDWGNAHVNPMFTMKTLRDKYKSVLYTGTYYLKTSDFFSSAKTEYLVLDKNYGGMNKIRAYVRMWGTEDNRNSDRRLIVLHPMFPHPDEKLFNMDGFMEDVKKFIKAVGNPKYTLLSQLVPTLKVLEKVEDEKPPAPPEPRVYQKYLSTVYVGGSSFSSSWKRDTKAKVPDTGYQFYVRALRGKPVELRDSTTAKEFERFWNWCSAHEVFELGGKALYSFAPHEKLPTSGATWVELFDYVDKTALDYLKDPKNRKKVYENKYDLRSTCYVGEFTRDYDWRLHRPHEVLSPESPYLKAIQLLRDDTQDELKIWANNLALIEGSTAKDALDAAFVTDAFVCKRLARDLKRRYPLLVEGGFCNQRLVLHYVMGVDYKKMLGQDEPISICIGEQQ